MEWEIRQSKFTNRNYRSLAKETTLREASSRYNSSKSTLNDKTSTLESLFPLQRGRSSVVTKNR